MAITASDKRGRLEDAWASSGAKTPPSSLRAALRNFETTALAAIRGGSLQQVKSNGHEYTFEGYGVGTLTPVEIQQCYRWLIDRFDEAWTWLTTCAQRGLDPFTTEMSDPIAIAAPNPPLSAQNQIVIDQSGRFAMLCAQYGIDPTTVINQTVKDPAVYLWLMFHTVDYTEARSDYSMLRVAEGGQML